MLTFDWRKTAPLKRMLSSLVCMLSVEAPPLSTMPVPPMTSVAAVPEPMSMRPSVEIAVIGPLAPVEAVSAAPKVTPPAAVSMMMSLSRCVWPMLALKKIEAVPALSVRSLRSAPTLVLPKLPFCELIVAALVKVMLAPPPASIVLMLRSDSRKTAPLRRIVSSLVTRANVVALPALMMMPAPPMTSSAFVPSPMSIAPSVETAVTMSLPPVLDVSDAPKMTPACARSIVKVPSRCVWPMLALKLT